VSINRRGFRRVAIQVPIQRPQQTHFREVRIISFHEARLSARLFLPPECLRVLFGIASAQRAAKNLSGASAERRGGLDQNVSVHDYVSRLLAWRPCGARKRCSPAHGLLAVRYFTALSGASSQRPYVETNFFTTSMCLRVLRRPGRRWYTGSSCPAIRYTHLHRTRPETVHPTLRRSPCVTRVSPQLLL